MLRQMVGPEAYSVIENHFLDHVCAFPVWTSGNTATMVTLTMGEGGRREEE